MVTQPFLKSSLGFPDSAVRDERDDESGEITAIFF